MCIANRKKYFKKLTELVSEENPDNVHGRGTFRLNNDENDGEIVLALPKRSAAVSSVSVTECECASADTAKICETWQ